MRLGCTGYGDRLNVRIDGSKQRISLGLYVLKHLSLGLYGDGMRM